MENLTEKPQTIIDLTYLNDLSKGNEKFVKEMIALFISENPEELKALEKGIRERDYDLIKNTAHKLRSTIPFMGLDKIIENEVEEIETMATDRSDIVGIEKRFLKIKETCERAAVELVTT